MDPLAALSLASNIIQLVEFGSKIVSTSQKLKASASGALSETIDLEVVTKDLSNISIRLKQGVQSAALSGPSLKGGCPTAFRYVQCFHPSIRRLEPTISGPSRFLKIQKIDLLEAPNNQQLDIHSQKLLRALEDGQRVFAESLQSQTEEIAVFHSKTTDHNASEHKETLSAIISAIHQANRGKRRRNVKTDNWDETLEQRKDREEQRKAQLEQIILEIFRYPHISERYLRLEKAHKTTFKWMFNDPRPQDRLWSSFAEWLRCGKGIY
ncbi:hypothetical protein BKA64DRAFT_720887 [Cadophora sp. MPI-SDFR-AT-0126]|nr:hypothetical protein BKA64DRAFT_720887 [Leotiomycetes sp. MPI-SDFR-AT-0126]